MANALFKVALIITIRDGLNFINLNDLEALRREDLEEAKEATAKARKVAKVTTVTKGTDRSRSQSRDGRRPEIAHRLRGEIVPVEMAFRLPRASFAPC